MLILPHGEPSFCLHLQVCILYPFAVELGDTIDAHSFSLITMICLEIPSLCYRVHNFWAWTIIQKTELSFLEKECLKYICLRLFKLAFLLEACLLFYVLFVLLCTSLHELSTPSTFLNTCRYSVSEIFLGIMVRTTHTYWTYFPLKAWLYQPVKIFNFSFTLLSSSSFVYICCTIYNVKYVFLNFPFLW